ncbi:fatty acid desaturase [Kaistia geumhonensis]|uniref:Omega-6 fatty acid desaturase (Delta-12 desaturase) n=1 Tax=Kaistia geumhonensis TaxID=410839 RepID=A0ABU0M860_9HYPH|nr:fatty acid desaturase [Kaistia geumhonensis]MCX5477679.1 fatty acid desaturase [Kaistia geumhonensis]MDQ0517112.1 omega-6 fatty acid desaturase (delta-12 desaturase) [Kaistia geumhonensis]
MVGPAQDAKALLKSLSRYRETRTLRSGVELTITALPLVGLWLAMWFALDVGYWLVLLLAVPAAAFLMRLFMIQHDCGHGAFFRRRASNDWTGRLIGVVTLTPYSVWRRTHATHHANVGNLDRRGIGDIDTLTVAEYLALSPSGRLRYRIYRHPAIMFGAIPAYLFLVHQRLPFGLMRSGPGPWISAMGTNLAIAAIITATILLIGIGPFVMIHGPVVLIAGSLAMWFFYVQHQFDGTQWTHDETWSFHEAALNGSSHYELPRPLAWFTGNIGVHHVHHLCSSIPFYRLSEVLHDRPDLIGVGRLTLRESFRCATLALWDEGDGRLISFREVKQHQSRRDEAKAAA